MYNYALFATDTVNKRVEAFEGKRSCREYFVRALAKIYDCLPDRDLNIYFGHSDMINKSYSVASDINTKLLEYSNLLWKDKTIVCELVSINDIKDSVHAERYKEAYSISDIPLLKVNKKVNPFDVSLLLTLSWNGKYVLDVPEHKFYFFAKRFTNLIPDLCPEDINYLLYDGDGNYKIDGPASYYEHLSLVTRTKIRLLFEENKEELL